jgi:hypothetical protein
MRNGGVAAPGIRIAPMLDDRIDGLLLLVEAGLTMSALSLGWGLWKEFPQLVSSIDLFVAILGSGSIVAPMATGMAVIGLASRFFFLAFCANLLVLIWKKDRLFPRLMVRYLVANAIILCLNAMTCWPLSLVLGFDAGEVVSGALGSIGMCIVWIPYFRKSPRVRETFIR